MGEAKAGLKMEYSIGDSWVSWDTKNNWTHNKVQPNFTFTPTVSGKAEFQGDANFTVSPIIALRVNQLFKYELTLNPKVRFQIEGSVADKHICSTPSYNVGF